MATFLAVLSWVMLGFVIGLAVIAAIVGYVLHDNKKRRARRASEWQKIKKQADQDIMKEWDI